MSLIVRASQGSSLDVFSAAAELLQDSIEKPLRRSRIVIERLRQFDDFRIGPRAQGRNQRRIDGLAGRHVDHIFDFRS